MSDQVLARLAALKTTPTPKLKEQWRQLFESEPPAFNRRYLESRLAYRIQELAYGGLKPETVRRLEKLGEELDGGGADVRKRPAGVCQSSCHLNLFHAASRSCPAMGAPPPASWGSASAPPRPCCSSLGRSGLSQTDPTGSQFRVLPDQRAGLLARAA